MPSEKLQLEPLELEPMGGESLQLEPLELEAAPQGLVRDEELTPFGKGFWKGSEQAIRGAPEAAAEIGGTAWDLLTKPAQPASWGRAGRLLMGAGQGVAKTVGNIASLEGERIGEAVGEGVAGTAMQGALGAVGKLGMKGTKAAYGAYAERPSIYFKKGTQNITAALKPNPEVAESIKNTAGDFSAYIKRTGRTVDDSKAGAVVLKDATDDFLNTNYKPLQQEIKKVAVEFQGQMVDADWLLARRAELNDQLALKGYYSKNPIAQQLSRSAPGIEEILTEQNTIRSTLNKVVDKLTPTNVGAANILRKFADMKDVSDLAFIKSRRIELANDIKEGSKPTMWESTKEFGKDVAKGALLTAGSRPVGAAYRAIKSMGSKPAIDPDALFAKGVQNWLRGAGSEPIPIRKVPIKFPGEPLNVPPPGQAELPMVPPGVGAMANELPLEQFPEFQMQMPNELTRQFNQPLGPAKPPDVTGQYQMPFVPQQVGGMATELPLEPGFRPMTMPNALTREFRQDLGPAKPAVTAAEAATAQKIYDQIAQKLRASGFSEAEIQELLSTPPTAGQERLPFAAPSIGSLFQ